MSVSKQSNSNLTIFAKGHRPILIVAYSCALLLLGTIAFGMHSASATPENLREYMQVLSDEGEGYERERMIDGVVYKMRFIPPELLAYRELRKTKSHSAMVFDSLCEMYSGTVAFELCFRAAPPNENIDVVNKNISSRDEYSDRVKKLNFDMQELLRLRVGETSLVPDFALAENVYAIKPERVVLVVFSDTELSAALSAGADIRLEYADEVFNTGRQYFKFAGSDLLNCPEFPANAALARLTAH